MFPPTQTYHYNIKKTVMLEVETAEYMMAKTIIMKKI